MLDYERRANPAGLNRTVVTTKILESKHTLQLEPGKLRAEHCLEGWWWFSLLIFGVVVSFFLSFLRRTYHLFMLNVVLFDDQHPH